LHLFENISREKVSMGQSQCTYINAWSVTLT